MTTLAEPRHATRPRLTTTPTRPSRQAQTERSARTVTRRIPRSVPLLSGGIVWIVVVAVFLGLLVAVNVGVLKLNVELDQLGQERSDLRAEIASARARLSSAGSTQRVSAGARARLGLVPADPERTIYVSLR